MSKTKLKLIQKAIDRFNREGVNKARIQDIAADAGMGLSNLTYHFKTKEELVVAVFQFMKTELEEKVYVHRRIIRGDKGLELTKATMKFSAQFRFFYMDAYNILKTYPALRTAIREHIEEAIQITKTVQYLAIGMGYLKPEPPEMPGAYDTLALNIWMLLHFWFAQMEIRGIEGDPVQSSLKAHSHVLYPYLTEKGKQLIVSHLESLEKMP
ncbi:MAG: TetR/AcrR family transcriptional regulator [Bacteroidota bacterium]